jgi:hypothetical protein
VQRGALALSAKKAGQHQRGGGDGVAMGPSAVADGGRAKQIGRRLRDDTNQLDLLGGTTLLATSRARRTAKARDVVFRVQRDDRARAPGFRHGPAPASNSDCCRGARPEPRGQAGHRRARCGRGAGTR